MSEQADRIREKLLELQTELGRIQAVDPEIRGLLESAASDIHGKLASKTPTQDESIVDRLRSVARHFEEDHPTIAGLVENTIDLLGRMGI